MADSSPPALDPDRLPTAVIEEIAAVGAAVGANCEPCLSFHYDKARRLGLTNEQLVIAVSMAQRVKNAPAAKILNAAARLLDVDVDKLTAGPPAN